MPAFTNVFMDPALNIMGDLLGDEVSTTDGEWVDISGYDKLCLGILVTVSATVIVCGSMASSRPLSSYHGASLFGTKVYAAPAEEILAIKTPIHWLKVRVTANGGQVNCPFIGV